MIVLFTRGPLAVTAGQQFVILEKPVKVTATNLNDSEADEDYYHLEMKIEHGAGRYKFDTLLFLQSSNINKAIEYQKARTNWKGLYLLVGWERGGGNASRGYLDTIFKLKKGKLLYLGEVDADSFESGLFKDWYDKFESNQLTSHAESPLIRLVLEEKDGHLVVDLKKTWTENQKKFVENKEIIKYVGSTEKMKSESRASRLAGPLLFNAVLSKYCKHEKDTRSFENIAEEELDKERLKLFKGILERVIPGELPKATIEVKKY